VSDLHTRLPVGLILPSNDHSIIARWLSDTWWRLALRPNYPDPFGRQLCAQLDSSFFNGHIEISDLTGTGPGSPFHNRGVAALLFAGWFHHVSHLLPPTSRVIGEVLDVHDPEGQDRRVQFWRRQGFDVRLKQPGHAMEARLRDLRPALRPKPVLDFTPPADWLRRDSARL